MPLRGLIGLVRFHPRLNLGKPLELLHRHHHDDWPAALCDRHWFGAANANHGSKPNFGVLCRRIYGLDGLLADPLDELDRAVTPDAVSPRTLAPAFKISSTAQDMASP